MKRFKLQDFDPEELLDPAPSDSDGTSDEQSVEDAHDGREHYVDVGKSELRKRDAVPLGPQYEGSWVSRDIALDNDSDEPFAKGFGGESSERESESDSESANGVGLDRIGKSCEKSDENSEDLLILDGDQEESSQEDEEATEAEDSGSDNEDEDNESVSEEDEDDIRNRANLRRIMSEEQKNVAATISQAAKADAEKGQAVKAQRSTFDSLLNSRIRLQKALISTNSFPPADEDRTSAPTPGDEAIHAAETAALNLLMTLSNLHSTLDATRTGAKRKRPISFTNSTLSSAIWVSIQASEAYNLPNRRTTLEKWSAKSRPAPILPHSRRLNNSATTQQTITDVLDTHLSDSARLIKRTRTPRSCAPVQSAAGLAEATDIYDDADFYGILLKELLEQRSQDISTGSNSGVGFIAQTPWQAAREAKAKRVVDTRASKGRKLRYTVHEKLQNFMAPEDRGAWGERQIDELFGSLFGRRMELGEEVEKSDEDIGDNEDLVEQGLLLFRS
ncbi:TRAUB-domain-containing protein [Glonium stellatum]|uniref:Protein BFR2 n=1 Tax=Glonium stellatum TaxID=574774 RepID=A0A8E2ERU4_9PEZI|nr:TRAUB-domain-containing protein [Glonium stellatum]